MLAVPAVHVDAPRPVVPADFYPHLVRQRPPLASDNGVETLIVNAFSIHTPHVEAIYTRWLPVDDEGRPRVHVWVVTLLFTPTYAERTAHVLEELQQRLAHRARVYLDTVGFRDREPLHRGAVCIWARPRTPVEEALFVQRVLQR